MSAISEIFGSMVFNDSVMKDRLPKETYKELQETIRNDTRLDMNIASIVANAMKEWAVEKGATHFTHWFQPMTGITAEKHDSFITPTGKGTVIMEFSGKELIQGEPDASSFPSGGLRSTFEARGYTAWDPTSYAFIKDDTLCIPTAFCSYSGEALDKKTPLLRSMQAINKQAERILRLFGADEKAHIKTTVGPEQEYFLIDKEMFDKRKDLIYTGRTLYGAKPPKGQELDDHYFGSIKPRVAAFMKELDIELWKLGVLAKTEHNEVAPAQHELAPIYTTTNIAADHNQLTMEIMQKIAKKHGMVCLLHEKPFAGINGSGKHNNWSISTDAGFNLLEPGETPSEKARFLLFICAIIKAVDEYQDLLRISVATAGNDHRLGANEAPPAIMSIFLGSELTAILDAIKSGIAYDAKKKEPMKIGVQVLPRVLKDTTDRNRTSPFAFTGNKFEFRSLGSNNTISCSNIMLNTAVAEELRQFADILENTSDFEASLNKILKDTVTDHSRIIFNGNGYEESWKIEAEKRGLLNLRTTPDCMPYLLHKKNVDLFIEHDVFSETEVKSRYEIILENYCKILNIEALTMLDMAKKDILPSVSKYSKELADTASAKKALFADIDCTYEESCLKEISSLMACIFSYVKALDTALSGTSELQNDVTKLSMHYKDSVIPAMENLRKTADTLETITAKAFWPYPSYGDILFSVK